MHHDTLRRFALSLLIVLGATTCFVSCAQGVEVAPAPKSAAQANVDDALQISPEHPERIQTAIVAAAKAGKHEIVIPPGVYHVPPSNVQRGHDGSHLKFENIKDLDINATGATLIFTDRWQHSIVFLYCENVTFRGAKMQRGTIPFSQGKIEALSTVANTVDVRVDKGYPSDLMDRSMFPVIWFNVFDLKNNQWLTHLRADSPPKMEQLEPDLFRVKVENFRSVAAPIEIGQRLSLRGQVFNDLVLSRCKNMKILDVNVERGAGFCFGERGGEGGNLFQNCSVTPGSIPAGATDEPLFASNADGFHSGDTRKGPALIHCSFEKLDDDAIAIHGTYEMVLEANGNKIIAQRGASSGTPLIGLVGDTLRFYDKKMLPAGTAKIVETKKLRDYQPTFVPDNNYGVFRNRASATYVEITLDQEIPAEPLWLIVNQNELGSGFVVRDCTIRNTYARGIIAKASDGLIENCTIENTARAAIEFNTETGIWSEADFVHNIIVRNNTFRNVSLNNKTGFLRHVGSVGFFAYKDRGYVPAPGGHRNITIENNLFENNDGVNLFICSAQGVTVRNNTFLRPMFHEKTFGKERGIDSTNLIWVDQSTDVKIENNTLQNPGPFFSHTIHATENAKVTGLEDGVKTVAPKP